MEKKRRRMIIGDILINKGAYGQHGSKFGWDVHHKIPKSSGGADAKENLEIVHVKTHDKIHGR